MTASPTPERHIGLFGATGIGVGAIVGGGILALAGVALAATGPSAIVAFALNGVIALLTALSFAEMASKFPYSGGTYAFAKKGLSIEAAFNVGWIVWFASIVAAMLYALGFGHFAAMSIDQLWRARTGSAPTWLLERPVVSGLACVAIVFFAVSLTRRSAGGGQIMNVGKVVVFGILISGGLWVLAGQPASVTGARLEPFFSAGAAGLFQAMGYTFIALQGFDLIAAVGGEVREPERTVPRAMFLSLGIALLVYLPLLFVVSTVGVPPGQTVTAASRENPEMIVAISAENYLGPFGYWLVMVAAILSMLSALQANLLAASRVAMSMARDHTLPRPLASVSQRWRTPAVAVIVTATVVVAIVVLVPNVTVAGAVSSLVFLITFALAHWIAILVRQRSVRRPPPFRSPLFPLVPVLGGLTCAALAVFQGIAVPTAGWLTLGWLLGGVLLFLALFARRARVADATQAALDPEVVTLRGRNPLVLVPIVRPDSAGGLIALAHTLEPPMVGRVLTLSIVVAPRGWSPDDNPEPLVAAQSALAEVFRVAAAGGVFPEALATVAVDPWQEMGRVARVHRCETMLLGLSRVEGEAIETPVDRLFSEVGCDVVVLRAERDWQLADAERVLVPTAGQGGQDRLLARLLGSLGRTRTRQVTFLRVLPTSVRNEEERAASRRLRRFATDLSSANAEVRVVPSDDALATITEAAAASDLVVLGVQRSAGRRRMLGSFTLRLAGRTTCPLLIICRKRSSGIGG